MHGKGKFSKIKGSICNIPIEAANTCNILPRPAVSNGLIIAKLKRDLNIGVMYISNQFAHMLIFKEKMNVLLKKLSLMYKK